MVLPGETVDDDFNLKPEASSILPAGVYFEGQTFAPQDFRDWDPATDPPVDEPSLAFHGVIRHSIHKRPRFVTSRRAGVPEKRAALDALHEADCKELTEGFEKWFKDSGQYMGNGVPVDPTDTAVQNAWEKRLADELDRARGSHLALLEQTTLQGIRATRHGRGFQTRPTAEEMRRADAVLRDHNKYGSRPLWD